MRTESGTRGGQCLPLSFVITFLYCLTFAITPLNLLADGCFVVPKFVWDKHKDINEPTQKAIIVHDSGLEELILQVKYEGPLEEFGWLIPVPNLPTVKKGSMECFYELSKFTQKNMEPRRLTATLSLSNGSKEPEPPVKVIVVKTVGAYDIAVLSTKDSAALENWLQEHQFAFPANAAGVIDGYVKEHWYFIAVKINLQRGSQLSTSEKLASGELHPLQISFASEHCVFPLKISSLNHTPSEVQIYVLSPEPLVEIQSFEKSLSENYRWRTNRLVKVAEMMAHSRAMRASVLEGSGLVTTTLPPASHEPNYGLGRRSEINRENLMPCVPVGRKDTRVCTSGIALLNNAKRHWLIKQTWTFQPEEMRDLQFDPAVPIFAAALAHSEGALAAENLVRLGTNGVSALIAAMRDTNPAVRAHATLAAGQMFDVPYRQVDDRQEDLSRRTMNPELLRLLPTLLNDPDPEVRLEAVCAAMNSPRSAFFERMVQLLQDDYAEIGDAALIYLRHRWDELPKHVPLFRQMLKETNETVQIAGLQLLSQAQAEIPRADLLALFSIPREELAGAAMARLKQTGITCEEAKPLLHNSLGIVRMMGQAVLMMNANSQSVELAIPMLQDPLEPVQLRAHDILTDLTGQNFPGDQPGQWEKWWEQNKATFKVTISPEELRQKQRERMRQRQRTEPSSPP